MPTTTLRPQNKAALSNVSKSSPTDSGLLREFESAATLSFASAEEELAYYKAIIAKATHVCTEAANGNLEERVLNVEGEGDLPNLLNGINHLLDLTDAFVREATASLEHASKGQFHRRFLLDGMRGTFRHAAESINEATSEMEEKTRALQEAETRRLALSGEFQKATEVVQELQKASEEIGNISNMIGLIANQSNLLALSATIESARVGEAGKGFAVVAFEVKRLSDRTSQATKDISSKVSAIQTATSQVASAIEEIRGTLGTK